MVLAAFPPKVYDTVVPLAALSKIIESVSARAVDPAASQATRVATTAANRGNERVGMGDTRFTRKFLKQPARGWVESVV
jgi:hypothetical protein